MNRKASSTSDRSRTIKSKRGLIALPFLVSGCGGGGAEEGRQSDSIQGDSRQSDGVVSIGSSQGSIALSYFDDGSTSGVVRYFYPADISGGRGDELIIAGFETQPNSPEQYSNTRLHVLSVDFGSLAVITDAKVRDGASQLEGVGDIVFGDFNADGLVDFFTSAYADMDYIVNAYEFMNSGDGFSRRVLDVNEWQHGAAVKDINKDGYDDVLVIGYNNGKAAYFGSPLGLVEYSIVGDFTGGSGVVLGDFIGNGSIQVIAVDAGGIETNDSILYQIEVDVSAQSVRIDEFSRLPEPRLEGEAFEQFLPGVAERSHDVRVEALDFNGDGRLDVIVFSRAFFDSAAQLWPELSQIQFLRNDGGGRFTDVTDDVLPNYDYRSAVSYTPIFSDFNSDGHIDMFLSDSDYEGRNDSSVFLFGSDRGVFVEAGRELLSNFVSSSGAMATVLQNDSGDFVLVVGQQMTGASGTQEILTSYPLDFL